MGLSDLKRVQLERVLNQDWRPIYERFRAVYRENLRLHRLMKNYLRRRKRLARRKH